MRNEDEWTILRLGLDTKSSKGFCKICGVIQESMAMMRVKDFNNVGFVAKGKDTGCWNIVREKLERPVQLGFRICPCCLAVSCESMDKDNA